ncbi:MAG: hypothetical protein ABSF67_10360 [Roseiarcus sp.]|jgi:hypothetical protein
MNIIDSLVVTLQLDPENRFERKQKETVESFEKTKKKLEEHSKGINEQTDKMVTGFKRLGTEILSLFGIIASADAIKRFVEQTTDANSQLKLLSENLAVPARQMQTWAAAAREYGGSLDATVNSVQSLTDKLTALRTFGQDPGRAFWFLQGQPGGKPVNGPDSVQDTKNLADDIQMMFRSDPQKANLIGRTLGIDPGTLNAWERGGSTAGDQFAGTVPTKEALERSQQLVKAQADAGTAAANFGAVLVDRLTPALIAATNEIKSMFEALEAEQKKSAADKARDVTVKPGAMAAFEALIHGSLSGPLGALLNWKFGKQAATPGQTLGAAINRAPTRNDLGYLSNPDLQGIGNEFRGGTMIDGRPISRANPMPVTIAETQGATGGFWSNLGSAIDKAFGGSGSAPPSAPSADAPAGNGWWSSVGKTLSGVFGGPANAALPPGGGVVPTPGTPGYGPGSSSSEVRDYITAEAKKRGIDPTMPLRIAGGEGGFNPNWVGGGDDQSSFGPFQLHYGGISARYPHAGLGDEFTRETGLSAKTNATWRQQVQFALNWAVQHGWGDWSGSSSHSDITGRAGIAPNATTFPIETPPPASASGVTTPFFGRNPGGRWSAWAPAGGWALDWGATSAAARAAMVGSGSVTNTTSSSEVNIGHIDLHSGATDAFGLAQDFARSLKEQSSAMGANYGAM